MNADELLKIEQQGADFVRALITHLSAQDSPVIGSVLLMRVAGLWRGRMYVSRFPTAYWRDEARRPKNGFAGDMAFFAGAETAIREYEASL